MEVRLFGGLEVRDRDRALDLGPPKQRAALAVLVLEAGRVVFDGTTESLTAGSGDRESFEAALVALVGGRVC